METQQNKSSCSHNILPNGMLHEISLQEKTQIETIRFKGKNDAAIQSFPSLFLWQEELGLSLHLEEDFYAVKTAWGGENTWYFPCGSEEKKLVFLEKHRTEKNFHLVNLRDTDAAFLQGHFPHCFEIQEAPSDSEYLYHRETMVHLKGRKYAHLRNHLNRAGNDHRPEVRLLTPDDAEIVREIDRVWAENSRNDGKSDLSDRSVMKRLIDNMEALGVFGILVLVNREPFAVAGGYDIGNGTFDLCFAKQKSFLSGMSFFAKHALFCALPSSFDTINAEDDMGIEGLRTLKKQMQPSGMLTMHRAKVRG